MWSEYVNPENIDSRIWPRNAAIAERLWSSADVRDASSMYARMESVSRRLEWLGLTHRTYYHKMLQRIAGYGATPEELAALKTLADVVEPVKDYTREETAPAEPTSLTPMNRIVDAIPLESDEGRRFSELVDKFITSSCQDGDAGQLLFAQFAAWRDNDAKLRPLARRSSLVREVSERSEDLSALAEIGFSALIAAAKRPSVPDDWKAQQLTAIEQIKKPKAQLLLIPASAVQKLVEAASPGGACFDVKK